MTPPITPGCSLAIHAVNADQFRPGQVFGWQSEDSPTGFFTGIVERIGPCVVFVRNVQLGEKPTPDPYGPHPHGPEDENP